MLFPMQNLLFFVSLTSALGALVSMTLSLLSYVFYVTF